VKVGSKKVLTKTKFKFKKVPKQTEQLVSDLKEVLGVIDEEEEPIEWMEIDEKEGLDEVEEDLNIC
jgi:hypothetical protein